MSLANTGSAVLETNSLTKKFGDLTAVGGLNLTLAPGECLALLGPNGAGKTTTVEMLEGLLPPTSGTLKLFGLDMQTDRRAIMERIGVMLQETNLYKRYTVKETLELFASFYKKSEDPSQIISQLNLTDKTDVQLKKLSGGQKQRVYLGACLINDPELIFLDEPTTGLDPQSRRSIWDILASLKSRNRSMLLTTHYMEEAERLADRIAIMDHGMLIAEGTPKSLIRQHCGEQIVTVTLQIDGVPLTEPEITAAILELRRQHQIFEQATNVGGSLEIITDSASAAITAVIEALRSGRWQIQEMNLRSGSLEDVFLKLTGRSIRDA